MSGNRPGSWFPTPSPRCRLVSSLFLLFSWSSRLRHTHNWAGVWGHCPSPWRWPMAGSKHFFLISNLITTPTILSWRQEQYTADFFTGLDTFLNAEPEWDLFALRKWLTTCTMMTKTTSYVIWEVLWWSTTTCWSRLLLRLDQRCKIWTSWWCTLGVRPRIGILLAFAMQMLFWIWSAFIRRNAPAVVIGIKQPGLAVCNSPCESYFI